MPSLATWLYFHCSTSLFSLSGGPGRCTSGIVHVMVIKVFRPQLRSNTLSGGALLILLFILRTGHTDLRESLILILIQADESILLTLYTL
ncbi:hypothetical protein PUNSTDRAFT_53428 [Punctularia strigosozonata HHB-11173 SS5]|uniref:uncharacterized protein n=1 Tax=Punctularia strigosozonata (strain HHB-11173) TaxID=741275 RepID=UPI0004417E48|nr:uncharacterized protein PUNSTDRAFT_53428 [Punctularia strigosozonata HHB-11173 SS5]EIN07021.1 hypothetical protein PUNSTDRAFT_53428 [Punctularia strigosozonata HHB-11173 SS5]